MSKEGRKKTAAKASSLSMDVWVGILLGTVTLLWAAMFGAVAYHARVVARR